MHSRLANDVKEFLVFSVIRAQGHKAVSAELFGSDKFAVAHMFGKTAVMVDSAGLAVTVDGQVENDGEDVVFSAFRDVHQERDIFPVRVLSVGSRGLAVEVEGIVFVVLIGFYPFGLRAALRHGAASEGKARYKAKYKAK